MALSQKNRQKQIILSWTDGRFPQGPGVNSDLSRSRSQVIRSTCDPSAGCNQSPGRLYKGAAAPQLRWLCVENLHWVGEISFFWLVSIHFISTLICDSPPLRHQRDQFGFYAIPMLLLFFFKFINVGLGCQTGSIKVSHPWCFSVWPAEGAKPSDLLKDPVHSKYWVHFVVYPEDGDLISHLIAIICQGASEAVLTSSTQGCLERHTVKSPGGLSI